MKTSRKSDIDTAEKKKNLRTKMKKNSRDTHRNDVNPRSQEGGDLKIVYMAIRVKNEKEIGVQTGRQ